MKSWNKWKIFENTKNKNLLDDFTKSNKFTLKIDKKKQFKNK